MSKRIELWGHAQVTLYACGDFNLIDTPGVGDHAVSPADLVGKIEEALTHPELQGGIKGVLVTIPVPDGRIRLGAQIVQMIVDKGFIATNGHDKFANIILVGTKVDKADEADRKNFLEGLNGDMSVRDTFFGQRGDGLRLTCMVSKYDYSPLRAAIKSLPAAIVQYVKPSKEVMAEALAECMGWKMEELAQQIEEQRRELDRIRDQSHRMKAQQQQERRQQEEAFQDLEEAMVVARCSQCLELQHPKLIHNTSCNFCGRQPLVGRRYHCTVCPKYDLCQSCFRLLDHEHEMLEVHQGVTCRSCQQAPLLGRRYMCTECVDGGSYDLCYACCDSGMHHHRMIEVHLGITCDGCEQTPLLGERFRCPECHDFDLCKVCHRKSSHPHEMYSCSEWALICPNLAV